MLPVGLDLSNSAQGTGLCRILFWPLSHMLNNAICLSNNLQVDFAISHSKIRALKVHYLMCVKAPFVCLKMGLDPSLAKSLLYLVYILLL